MLTSVTTDYASLSPKGRLILSVLVRHYARNGDDALTRQQLAEHIGQYRLYPHDDRAIHRLRYFGWIFISEDMLGNYSGESDYADYGVPRPRRNITYYTRFHVHWLNGDYYHPLVKLLAADGLYQSPGRVAADVLGAAGSVWDRLTGWLRR